jgi:RNA polymerase sigma-70 factor, ECF subfamily
MAVSPPVLRLHTTGVSLSERSDDELMQLAAADLDEAYAALVRRYQATVRATCRRSCGSSALGDEIAQEIFVQLWCARRAYEPVGRFRPYLFTLVRNRCRNASRRVRETAPLADPLVSREPDPVDELLAAQRRRRVDECLAKLPDDQREAIALRFSAELDYAEIAHVAGRSEATIRSRVFLGLARLRKLLGKGDEP